MYVFKLRFSMLKNGSRTGYFSLPHNTVCSKMCATPVESVGVVLKVVLRTVRTIEYITKHHIPKHIVGVVAFNVQMTCAGYIVHQIISGNIAFWNEFFLFKHYYYPIIILGCNKFTYLRNGVIVYFLPNVYLEFASFYLMLDPDN